MKKLITITLALMLSLGAWANGATVVAAWEQTTDLAANTTVVNATDGAGTLSFIYASGDPATLSTGGVLINVPNAGPVGEAGSGRGWWTNDLTGAALQNIPIESSSGWVFTLNTTGYENIRFSADQGASNNGPAQFRFAYRIGTSGPWTEFGGMVTIPGAIPGGLDGRDMLHHTIHNLLLPEGVNNQAEVQIRVWIANNNRRSDGAPGVDGGNHSINNIAFTSSPVIAAWSQTTDLAANTTVVNATEGAGTLSFIYASGNVATLSTGGVLINVPNAGPVGEAGSGRGWWTNDLIGAALQNIPIESSAGWVITLNTEGYEDITFSAYQSASNNGPAQFRFAYRTGTSGPWTEFGGIVIIPGGAGNQDMLHRTIHNLPLPEGVNNQAEVQIRVWITNNNRRSDGAPGVDGGNHSINNVVFVGFDPLWAEPEEPETYLIISNISHNPTIPTQDDDITVTATVTYTTSPVASVFIAWDLDGVDQPNITMTVGADNVWTGTIPAQAPGVEVEFRIVAANEVPEITMSNWHSFNVIDAGGIIVAGSPDALANDLLILTAFGTGPTNAAASNRSFVELYNTTNAPINLEGITLFWANGIRGLNVTADEEWQAVELTGTIPAEGSFLVLGPIRRAAATGGLIFEEDTYGDMFVEDMILDNRAFKVALIRSTGTLLAPNPFDMDGAGAFAAGYIDMVGSANDREHANPDNIFGYEGAPTRNSGSSAVRRISLIDTDNNYEDFEEKRFAELSDEELAARRPRTSAAGAWDPFAALTALTISSVEHYPTTVTNENDVTVTATITAPAGVEIYTVYLEWVLNASDTDTTRVEMTLENDVWTATIPAQAEGAVVTYRVLATSDLDETVASTWRSFTVAVPTELVITNVSHYPVVPTADAPVTVSATVTYTTSDVASVVIEWRRGALQAVQPAITMTLGENNVWTGTIPQDVADIRITYVVVATNDLDEVTRSAEYEFTVAGGTNIAVVAENNSINIFPNPVRDILTVTVADFAPGMIFNLFDVNGRMVQTGPLAETTTIDMTNLRAGTYVLTIVQNGAQVATFRVVKQ